MISGLFVLVLTLICFSLLWKNHSEFKKHSLDKLDLENKIANLNKNVSTLDRENQKLFEKIKSFETAKPDDKVISIIQEFKYPTIFSSDRARNSNKKLVEQMKNTGYDFSRSYALWTGPEDSALQHRFNVENKSVQEVAILHKRTIKATASRLKLLKLL